MPTHQTAPQILDQVFLDVRAKLLEVAAALDRLDRASSSDAVAQDPRRQRIQKTLEILATQKANRAEQLQLLFSDNYDEKWPRPGAR